MASRKQVLVATFVIWLAAFAAFSNSFRIALQFDDTHTVQSNVFVRSLSYVPRYFQDAKTYSYRPENSGYRPMATLACALGFQLSHLDTWGYHLIKLLEHCLVATLLLLVGLRLLPRSGALAKLPHGRLLAAAGAALLFAVHRANTETVDYITAVSSLQAALFYLLAFYLYLRAREAQGRRAWALIGGSALCYFLGLLSKEEAITLPAMLVLYEWIYGRGRDEGYLERLKGQALRWAGLVLPYVAVAALFVTLRTLIQPAVADTSRGNIPRFIYFITQLRSWLHYWALFVWPVNLNADNLAFDFSTGLDDWRVWGALAAHLAIWAAAWRFGRRRRFVLFAVAWAYVTVLPASSVFPLVEAVNEHRMYIPYMFLALLSSWLLLTGFARIRQPKAGVAAIALLALLLGAGAYARNEVWQTDVSLWEDVISKNPDSPRALNVLGISLINQNEFGRGLQMLEHCHELSQRYMPCMVHLSIAYAHYKRFDEGLKLLLYANSLDPNYPHVNYHLGVYYKDYYGQFEKAWPHLMTVYKVTSGRFFQATIKLAEIYLCEDKFIEAEKIANNVLDLDISNGDAWSIVARARMLRGDLDGAAKVVQRLIESAPDVVRYELDYAHLLELRREYPLAMQVYLKIATLDANATQAYLGVERTAKVLGDTNAAAEARAKYEKLKAGTEWSFYAGMRMPGEVARQTRP